MTRVVLTWQKDETHSQDYDEEVVLGEEEASLVSEYSSISEESEELEDKLHNLDRATIFQILCDSLEQLSIIKAYVNEPIRPAWTRLFEFRTLEDRFTLVGSLKDEFVEEEYEKIPYKDTNKLQKDLCLIITTLKETAKEILLNGTFYSLIGVIEALQLEIGELKDLEECAEKTEAEFVTLKKVLIAEKKQYKEELESLSDTIAALKNELEDVLDYGKHEMRYTDRWENARTHLHELTLNKEEDVYNDVINKNALQTDYEMRIHNEIESYLLENTEDLKNDILYWMQEYDNQIEQRDDDILKLRMKWERLTDDHKALAELYEEHKVACEEWLIYKEAKRKADELFELQTKAAIKIQAWWRGTMYRKKLGPYRKKKGKGGKGGKDKKGKKK